jgi:DNA-binding transcriptional regulator YhcF (GntR family)
MIMTTITKNIATINQSSKLPKYQQLVNRLLNDIEKGKLQIGDRLPSINEATEEFYFSRDTVERAYSELYRLGVIISVLRKGYYVSGKLGKTKTKIFFLVGKITQKNKAIINSFVNCMGKDILVDIFTYDYNSANFRDIIEANQDKYHHYIIIPDFINEVEENFNCLKKIAGDRLILLDQSMFLPKKTNSFVFCNYGNEIYQVMQKNIRYFKKYKTFNLIVSEGEYFNVELAGGLRNFSEMNNFEFQVIKSFKNADVETGNVYFTLDDIDLVDIIKATQNQNLELGKQVGLISLNDSCYNEILAGGISVISSKPNEIGRLAADLINGAKGQSLNISMEMIIRKSL